MMLIMRRSSMPKTEYDLNAIRYSILELHACFGSSRLISKWDVQPITGISCPPVIYSIPFIICPDILDMAQGTICNILGMLRIAIVIQEFCFICSEQIASVSNVYGISCIFNHTYHSCCITVAQCQQGNHHSYIIYELLGIILPSR